ncbi:MAG: ferredoxin--NADP reductase [Proteobacteria bacterium]|nr:ferredoxin--NADP reductase [Pseudomonadota bacterium]
MKWVEGKIIALTQWAPGLYSIFVKAPILPFVAGQFTQIRLTQEKLFRTYSFVNEPADPNLEFYYVLVKAGSLTPQLATLVVDDKIWLSHKASGRFVLSEVPLAQNLWCFATGTGLGPFLSLLKTKTPWERFDRIVLVHSVRYSIELTHQRLIEAWQEQYPKQFNWCPIITREPTHHLQERIPQLLHSKKLEETVNLSINAITSQVMLCGNPSMINDVTQLLAQRGLKLNHFRDKGHITVENYWKSI